MKGIDHEPVTTGQDAIDEGVPCCSRCGRNFDSCEPVYIGGPLCAPCIEQRVEDWRAEAAAFAMMKVDENHVYGEDCAYVNAEGTPCRREDVRTVLLGRVSPMNDVETVRREVFEAAIEARVDALRTELKK